MNTSTSHALDGAFPRLMRPLGSLGRVVLIESPGWASVFRLASGASCFGGTVNSPSESRRPPTWYPSSAGRELVLYLVRSFASPKSDTCTTCWD